MKYDRLIREIVGKTFQSLLGNRKGESKTLEEINMTCTNPVNSKCVVFNSKPNTLTDLIIMDACADNIT